MHLRLPLLAAALLPLLLPAAGAGQSAELPLVGRVVDAETGQPVRGAVVQRDRRHRVLTDSAGRFAFPGLREGRYELEASSLGYADAGLAFDLAPGASATLRMTPSPVPLPALQAIARARIPGLDGRITGRVWGREDLLSFDDVAAYHFVHERAHLAVRPCSGGHYGWGPMTMVEATAVPRQRGEPARASLPDWGPIGGEMTDCIFVKGRGVRVRVLVDDQLIAYDSDELYARRTWDLARVEVLTSYTYGFAMVRIYTPEYLERRAARVYRLCDQLAAVDSAGGAALWSVCSGLR